MSKFQEILLAKYRLVLFDLDGTLIKSMELHYRCWSRVLEKFGKKISIQNFLLSEGRNIKKLMSEYANIEDKNTINNLIESKDKLFINEFKFELYEGALDLLSLLKKDGKQLGLVTASSCMRLKATAPPWFTNYFDVIIASEDGGRGKPFPDPYLFAAQKMAVAAKEVLVVENAPLGIAAARAAKMDCIGIANTLPAEYLNIAQWVFPNFDEICKKVI